MELKINPPVVETVEIEVEKEPGSVNITFSAEEARSLRYLVGNIASTERSKKAMRALCIHRSAWPGVEKLGTDLRIALIAAGYYHSCDAPRKDGN